MNVTSVTQPDPAAGKKGKSPRRVAQRAARPGPRPKRVRPPRPPRPPRAPRKRKVRTHPPRPRVNGQRAPKWRERWLRVLRETGVISVACRATHVARDTVRKYLREDPEFARQYEEAIEISTEGLEEAALARAKEKSDLLMIFMLKARKPLVYRERVEQLNLDPSTWTTRQLDAYIAGMPLRAVLALEDAPADRARNITPPAALPAPGGPA